MTSCRTSCGSCTAALRLMWKVEVGRSRSLKSKSKSGIVDFPCWPAGRGRSPSGPKRRLFLTQRRGGAESIACGADTKKTKSAKGRKAKWWRCCAQSLLRICESTAISGCNSGESLCLSPYWHLRNSQLIRIWFAKTANQLRINCEFRMMSNGVNMACSVQFRQLIEVDSQFAANLARTVVRKRHAQRDGSGVAN